jgi:hypothetical protein
MRMLPAGEQDGRLGLWNTSVVHTLRQTGPNFWVIADGQC